jgi:hypothetical protein
MSRRPKRTGFVVHLFIAATVLGLGFGGGVLFGWSTRKRPPTRSERSAESIPDAEVSSAHAACKRELKALAKARAKRPAAATPGERDDAGLERAAQVEALQKEVEECRVRETLQNAYVCGTIDNHINLMDVLIFGTSCEDTVGVGPFFINSLDKCAEFDDFPAHLDEDQLTQGEKNRIAESEMNRRFRDKKNLIRWEQGIRRKCRELWELPEE